jgi:ribosomal-protein-alanine N-acetyltransferase
MYCEIKTSRLNIRPINLVDSRFMLDLVNTKGWLKYIGDRKVHTVTDAEAYIKRILDNPLYFYHVIEMNDTTDPVGVISFLKRDTQQYYDIGFALLPAYEGSGIAFEASSIYIRKIQSVQVFENIIAICVPENLKSIRLLKKLGFCYQNDFKQGDEVLSLYIMNPEFSSCIT